MRSFFGFGADEKRGSRRLLISRRETARRRVLNEDDLVARLEPLGFERVYPETLTLPQQAAIFAEASHIIAPHGAGLGNMSFSAPGTRALEFFSAFTSPIFWIMANQLGHRYFAFECMGAENEYLTDTDVEGLGSMWARNHHDITVPIDDMVDYVENVNLAS